MEFCLYGNSYLDRYDAIKNYNSKPNLEIIKNKKKPTPIGAFKNKYFIDKNKIQEHKNYIDSKLNGNKVINLEIEKPNKKVNQIINYSSYSIKKEGYLSRLNKETNLLNKSCCGYELLKKNKDFDLVNISKPKFWPNRGYTETSNI